MDTRLDVRGDHLWVECRGEFDVGDARSLVGRIVADCAARGIERVLVDLREVPTTIGIGDRYDLAALLARAGAERLRMAFLVAPGNFFTKTFEDTATNRGLAVRTTTSPAEARAFLGLKDP